MPLFPIASANTPPVAYSVSVSSGPLVAGTNTITVVTAALLTVVTSVVGSYTGTIAGVTLQTFANSIAADIAYSVGTSGADQNLLTGGKQVYLNAAQTLTVVITSATAADTAIFQVQGFTLI